MEKFHEGQTVSHQLHGMVKVTDVDEDRSLVEVRDSTGKYFRVHPVSLTKVGPPKFEVKIQWARGTVTLSGPLYEDGVAKYLANLAGHLYSADQIIIDRIKPPVTKNA